MLEHEPGQARTFADAAVGDDWRVALNPLISVQLLQLVHAFEGPVVVAVLPPRDALGARNVAATLARFRQSWRRENFAGELRRTAHVDERRLLLRRRLLHIGQE